MLMGVVQLLRISTQINGVYSFSDLRMPFPSSNGQTTVRLEDILDAMRVGTRGMLLYVSRSQSDMDLEIFSRVRDIDFSGSINDNQH